MSLQRTQRETTSREFVRWRKYLRQDMNRRNKLDWYLAQIAAEIVKGRVEHPKKVKTEDLLITFEKKKEPKRISRKEAAARSKSVWFSILGIQPQKPPPKRK